MDFLDELFYEPISGELYTRDGKVVGGYDEPGYIFFQRRSKSYRAHRVIWELHYGPIPNGMVVDHINSDGTDNRLENLRLATQAENNRNRSLNKNNTSGYKGVHFLNTTIVRGKRLNLRNPWRVQIFHYKKSYTKGGFATAKEAALHYNEKAQEIFGEYAKLNKI